VKVRALSIEGAYEITPIVRGDPRGHFAEVYRFDVFAAEIGHPLRIAQINNSTSSRDVQARTDLYVETGDRSYSRLPRTPTPVGHHARRTLNAPWITPRSTSR